MYAAQQNDSEDEGLPLLHPVGKGFLGRDRKSSRATRKQVTLSIPKKNPSGNPLSRARKPVEKAVVENQRVESG